MAALAGDVKIPNVAMSHIITIVFFIRFFSSVIVLQDLPAQVLENLSELENS